MAEDFERLVALVEANTKTYERSIVRLEKLTDRALKGVEKRTDQTSKKFDELARRVSASAVTASKSIAGAFMGAFGGGLIGGLLGGGLQGLVGSINDITSEMDDLQTAADKLDLPVEDLQAWRYAAAEADVTTEQLEGAFSALTKQIGVAARDIDGPVAKAFERLGIRVRDAEGNVKSTTDITLELAAAIQKLPTQQERFDAMFKLAKENGAELLRLLGEGPDAIRESLSAARELGLVIDGDLVQKAADVNRQWEVMGQRIDTFVKSKIVEAGLALEEFIDLFQDTGDQSTRSIERRITGIQEDIARMEKRATDLRLTQPTTASGRQFVEKEVAAIKAQIDALVKEKEGLEATVKERKAGTEAAKEAKPALDELSATVDESAASASSAAEKYKSYAEAIQALAGEVPALAEGLAKLDARQRIDAIYEAAMSKARRLDQQVQAGKIRDAALSALDVEAAGKNSAGYLGGFLGGGRSKQAVEGLSRDFAEALARMLASAPESVRNATSITSGFRSTERQAQLFAAAVAKYGSVEAARKWVAPPGRSQHNAGNAADLGFASAEARQWFHANAGQFGLGFPMGHEPWHIQLGSATAAARESAAMAGMDRQIGITGVLGDMDRQIQGLRDHAAALGMSAREANAYAMAMETIRQAEAEYGALSPEVIAQIKAKADEYAGLAEQVEMARQKQDALAEASEFLGQTLGDAIISAVPAIETGNRALDQLLNTLMQASLQALLLGQGALAALFGLQGANGGMGGLIGMLFGGLGRAGGGAVSPGVPYPVGERGPELFVPASAGRIVPKHQLGGMSGGGPTIYADFRGAAPEAVASIKQKLDALEKALPGTIVATTRTQRMRGARP